MIEIRSFEVRVAQLVAKGRWSDRQARIIIEAQDVAALEDTNELREQASVTAKSEGRTYLLGLPVSVTMHDDGTVEVQVHLEDASEAIRDEAGVQYGDEDSVAALTMETVEDDAVTFEQAHRTANDVREDTMGNLLGSPSHITVSWS